jgi:hypothetical protein
VKEIVMETWNPNSGQYEAHDALGIGLSSGILNRDIANRRQDEEQKRREEEEKRCEEEKKRRRGY